MLCLRLCDELKWKLNVAHFVGLYSSFLGCFFYTIFGSCKDSAIGPTAISALLTRENIHGLGPAGATILCLLNGIVVFLMGVFQFGENGYHFWNYKFFLICYSEIVNLGQEIKFNKYYRWKWWLSLVFHEEFHKIRWLNLLITVLLQEVKQFQKVYFSHHL